MGIAHFAVTRPVAVVMRIAALVLLGAICLTRLPVDLLPKVSVPTVSVVTTWPNVAPEEIEALHKKAEISSAHRKDVAARRHAAARALAEARARKVDFLSGFPRQMLGSPGEALLVPLMYLVLLSYLPLAFIRRVKLPSLSAGCGQFMLVRRAPYLEAGGHGAVRRTLHDGIMLARRMKSAGFPVGVFDAWDIARCRMYAGFRSCWRGFSRNAYEALGSPLALGAMIALNGSFFVLPFLAAPWALAVSGLSPAVAVWVAAVALALGLRALVAVRFSAPMWTVAATPVAVALLIGLQLHSFVNHCTGRPVVWRARAYPGAAPSRRT